MFSDTILLIELFNLFVVGAIPNEICNSLSLQVLNMGVNPGLTCYPSCLSLLGNLTVDGTVHPKSICPNFQDVALCGIIAATTIGAQYGEWSCTTDGLTTSDPCDVYSTWRLVTCAEGYVNSISGFASQSGQF